MSNYDPPNGVFPSSVELNDDIYSNANSNNLNSLQQQLTAFRSPNIANASPIPGNDILQLASPNPNQYYNNALYSPLNDDYLVGNNSGLTPVNTLIPTDELKTSDLIKKDYPGSPALDNITKAEKQAGTLVKNESELAKKKASSSQPKARPAFVMKLWMMINDPNNSEFIQWSADGKSFRVVNRESFMKNILPKYFKHSNFSSFVRQLNMYGWHKVQDLNAGSINATANNAGGDHKDEIWQFESPFFQRGREDLLDKIVRNKSGKTHKGEDNEDLNVNLVIHELNRIKNNQNLLADDLRRVRKDNSLLWQEVMLTRDRYNKQNDTLNNILRFIATVFQNNPSMGSREIGYDNNFNNILMSLFDANNKNTDNGYLGHGQLVPPDYSNMNDNNNINGVPNASVNAGSPYQNHTATYPEQYINKPRLMIMNDNNNGAADSLPYIQSPAGSIHTLASEHYRPNSISAVTVPPQSISLGVSSINEIGKINSYQGLDNVSDLDTLQGEIQRAPEDTDDNFIIPANEFSDSPSISSNNNNNNNNSPVINRNASIPVLNDNGSVRMVQSPRFRQLSDTGSVKSFENNNLNTDNAKLINSTNTDMGLPLNIDSVPKLFTPEAGQKVVAGVSSVPSNNSLVNSPQLNPHFNKVQSNINIQEQSINNIAEIIRRVLPEYDGASPVASNPSPLNNDFNVDEFLAAKSDPNAPILNNILELQDDSGYSNEKAKRSISELRDETSSPDDKRLKHSS